LKRSLFLALCWLLLPAGLYAVLAVLEVYWNLMDWSPRLDYLSLSLLAAVLLLQLFLWLVARVTQGKWLRRMAGVFCLVLIGIGLYCAVPEPLQGGVLGRRTISASWYRWSRVAVLTLPGAWWWWYGRKLQKSAMDLHASTHDASVS
jgi:hypothetical protein